jgi:two-component system, NarL family, nitrate/nitrite response regulator NarL
MLYPPSLTGAPRRGSRWHTDHTGSNWPAIRVALVVGIRFYREGIAQCLLADERFDVTAVAGSRPEAVRAMSANAPDVVVLDLGRDEGLALIRVLRVVMPSAKVLALGVHEAGEEVLSWVEAGAAGYVSRDGSLDDLIAGIVAAARGELHCPPTIAGALVRRLASLSESLGAVDSPLTSREAQVADLLERGLSNKEIASQLNIELATVKNHVHHVLEKLGANSRAEVRGRVRGLA